MRKADWSRRLVRENRLTVDDLIWPIFVIDGDNRREPIAAMPGVFRMTVDLAVKEAERAAKLGIPALATFPNVDIALRDQTGSHILDPGQRHQPGDARHQGGGAGDRHHHRRARSTRSPATAMTASCATASSSTTRRSPRSRPAAVMQAAAGADIIAPSDMMDGRIGAIRDALDANGFQDIAIMSYATKFASAFYGPYREAIGTAGLLKGDKKTYYIDHANSDEAVREAEQDIAEGADMLMVKPGLPYLDIIRRLKDEFEMPTFAYQVSGEYSMIKAAAANGWIDGEQGDAGKRCWPSSAPAATASSPISRPRPPGC